MSVSRRITILCTALLLTISTSGCLTQLEEVFNPEPLPQLLVTRHAIEDWNRIDHFEVETPNAPNATITITATLIESLPDTAINQQLVSQTNTGNTKINLHDGIWRIVVQVNGREALQYERLMIDNTKPQLPLRTSGVAINNAYTIGPTVTVPENYEITIREFNSQKILATELPLQLTGLQDGIHIYQVQVQDQANNWYNHTITVKAGEAAELPKGELTAGVVLQYSSEVKLWQLHDKQEYLTINQAQQETQQQWLGVGWKIDPNDAEVREIVQQTITHDMNTMQRAHALYEWMYANLIYDDERLESNDLLSPSETLENGGGVCRDLAALYVSLLRAAGVPARVVKGYLSGSVGDFHAWVEFYGGATSTNNNPWIPVDVSAVQGYYDDSTPQSVNYLMQSFAILDPTYVPLKVLTEAEEVDGWSNAVSVQYSYPSGEAPQLNLERELSNIGQDQYGILCTNWETGARKVIDNQQQCNQDTYQHQIGYDSASGEYRFIRYAERVLDYGVVVEQAEKDTDITLRLSYPVSSGSYGNIDYTPYGGNSMHIDGSDVIINLNY